MALKPPDSACPKELLALITLYVSVDIKNLVPFRIRFIKIPLLLLILDASNETLGHCESLYIKLLEW